MSRIHFDNIDPNEIATLCAMKTNNKYDSVLEKFIDFMHKHLNDSSVTTFNEEINICEHCKIPITNKCYNLPKEINIIEETIDFRQTKQIVGEYTFCCLNCAYKYIINKEKKPFQLREQFSNSKSIILYIARLKLGDENLSKLKKLLLSNEKICPDLSDGFSFQVIL